MLKFKRLKIITFVILFISIVISSLFIFSNCSNNEEKIIKLFNTQTNKIENISLDNYISGVVAGEISNEAPLEALKAQAILARTFTLKFLKENKSKFKGADISTDITEAQAYNKNNINDKIIKAVNETKNLVITYNNDYINSYFFSNSGGITALHEESFSSSDNNFKYIKSVNSPENKSNSINYSWTYSFDKNQILNALRNMGVSISTISSFSKGEIGPSGRCITFNVGGKEISSNTFRINIGSIKMKSTLIDNIDVKENSITFTGRGYGHGVGLSQEGSIILANQGKTYKEIINYYFNNVDIVSKLN